MTPLARRIDSLEEAYEFMLAYAATGAAEEDGRLRVFLGQLTTALDGLGDVARGQAERLPETIALPWTAFAAVLEADTARALSAVRLVAACRNVGSQLIDNLNANLHLRTVLTDLFLLDEILVAHGIDPTG